MSFPKIIPLWLFRTIGISLLIIDAFILLYFMLTESGPYAVIAELLTDDSNTYPLVLAVLLTFLIILIPTLVIALILRPFSNVPSFKSQMTDMGPLTTKFKTTIDTSQYGELPSVFSRALAFIIDRSIVILLIAVPAAFLIAVEEQTGRGGIIYYAMLAIFLLFLIAGVVYSYARDMFKGKSIARRILKQKVVDVTTGEPIGGWRSFKREIIIHFAPLIFIELILISSNKDRRRMGDNWAKTIVVKDVK
jgi:uncharacterized RDD family membrane protein YckC